MLKKHLEDLDSGPDITLTSSGTLSLIIAKLQFFYLLKKFAVKNEKDSLREGEDYS